MARRILRDTFTNLLPTAEIATIYEGIPAYEFRIATAKLFLELQKPETAAEILKILTLEQDNVAEVWYLLGFAYSNNKDLAANVLHCCLTARDVSIPHAI